MFFLVSCLLLRLQLVPGTADHKFILTLPLHSVQDEPHEGRELVGGGGREGEREREAILGGCQEKAGAKCVHRHTH